MVTLDDTWISSHLSIKPMLPFVTERSYENAVLDADCSSAHTTEPSAGHWISGSRVARGPSAVGSMADSLARIGRSKTSIISYSGGGDMLGLHVKQKSVLLAFCRSRFSIEIHSANSRTTHLCIGQTLRHPPNSVLFMSINVKLSQLVYEASVLADSVVMACVQISTSIFLKYVRPLYGPRLGSWCSWAGRSGVQLSEEAQTKIDALQPANHHPAKR